MAKRGTTKGKPKHYKRETSAQRAPTSSKRARTRRTDGDMRGRGKVLPRISLPRIFDKNPSEGIRSPDPELEGESFDDIRCAALGYIQEFAARVKQRCFDEKLSCLEKQLACAWLIAVASEATILLNELADGTLEPFVELIEDMPCFPCMFPARADELRSLQKTMWDDLNLGKRHILKIRPARGRKTFSRETWVNGLLLHYINKIYFVAYTDIFGTASPNSSSEIERSALEVPLIHENAKRWLDVIWKLLLIDIPDPETHPRLRQLGGRPSKVYEVRATIKAKLGTYLERMLNAQAVHKYQSNLGGER